MATALLASEFPMPVRVVTTSTDPPNPAEIPCLDPAALQRLREIDPDGCHGVVTRVLQAFERSLVALLVQLGDLASPAAGTEAARAQRVKEIGHMLKSSAASVGALALSEACAQAEARQRREPGLQFAEDLRRLITESERALIAVRAILGD